MNPLPKRRYSESYEYHRYFFYSFTGSDDSTNPNTKNLFRFQLQVQREVGNKLIQLYDSELERKVRKYLGSALSTLAEFVFCAPDDDDNYQEANWPELIQVCMKACINKETEGKREDGLSLLIELVPIYHKTLQKAKEDM